MSTSLHIGTGDGFVPPPVLASYDGEGNEHLRNLLRRYRLGLALFIAAIAMLFVGFSSAYIVRRGIPTYDAMSGGSSLAWESLRLPLALLLINTAALLGASITIEVARRAVGSFALDGVSRLPKPALPWICVSFCLGALFIAGQGFAWHVMSLQGLSLRTGARTAFFYVLTGTHALHAVMGVVVLAWIAAWYTHWSDVRRHLAVDLIGWYLHSMTVLWIYLLCFLLFA